MVTTQWSSALALAQRCRQLYYGVDIGLLLVTVAAASLLRYAQQQVESQIAVSSHALAGSLQQSVAQLLDAVDFSLQSVADEIGRKPPGMALKPAALSDLLDHGSARLPSVQVLAVDAQVRPYVGTGSAEGAADNVLERDFFQAQRDVSGNSPFLSAPVYDAVQAVWKWYMSRAVRSRDGAFLGVIYAHMDSRIFQDVLAGLRLEPHSTIALRDRNLLQVAGRKEGSMAYPLQPGTVGISEQMKQALAANLARGSYASAATALDDLRQLVLCAQPQYGFVVNFGLTVDTAHAAWR